MPLPNNSTLSLNGHSRPGDTQYSKPKQAMLVQMSVETFEALESQSRMQFRFGENPGITIGDAFFPLKPVAETIPHELYLRTSSATKPNAPLKLSANVSGKLMVERELGEKVQRAVRDRTLIAERQRTERKTILLDAPPVSSVKSTNIKKRKEPPNARRLAVPDTHRSLSGSSTLQSSRVASPRPPPSPARDPSARQRLIHFIALQHRTTEDVYRQVGGEDADAVTKRQLTSLLNEVAEQIPPPKRSEDTSPPKWSLKPESWLEVRPYEWEGLTSTEQTKLSRLAKMTYNSLKIPESDPRWAHVRYRDTSIVDGASSSRNGHKPNGSTAGSTTSIETKRQVSSTEQKKARPTEGATKRKATDSIIAKDEGMRSQRINPAKARDKEYTEITSSAAASRSIPRRLPGSGFKAKSSSNTPSPPARDPPPTTAQPSKKSALGDVREPKRVATVSSSSSSARSTQPLPPPVQDKRPAPSTASSITRVQKVPRETSGPGRIADSDRERGRDSPAPPIGFKRKKPREDLVTMPSEQTSSSVAKRRKVESGEGTKTSVKATERDLSLPKKPIVREHSPMPPPRPKHKKEPLSAAPIRSSTPSVRSPLPPARSPLPPIRSSLPPKPSVASSTPMSKHHDDQASQRSGSARSRRRSPIYTSSEEEEKEPVVKMEPMRDRELPPLKHTNDGSADTDEVARLRRLYDRLYPAYIAVFYKVVSTEKRVKELLAQEKEIWELGEEVAELEPEAVNALLDEYNAKETELRGIQNAYESLVFPAPKMKQEESS